MFQIYQSADLKDSLRRGFKCENHPRGALSAILRARAGKSATNLQRNVDLGLFLKVDFDFCEASSVIAIKGERNVHSPLIRISGVVGKDMMTVGEKQRISAAGNTYYGPYCLLLLVRLSSIYLHQRLVLTSGHKELAHC